jgi:hypothetical protein
MISNIDQTISTPADLITIEKGALKVRKENDELAALANELEERLTATKRELMPKIRRALERLQASSAGLMAEVQASRHLFEAPKTQVFHGIKVGWPKSRGGLEIVDEARTIERAEKLLTEEQVAMVVKVTKEIRKKALSVLSVDVLKKLGVNVRDAGEYPLVSITEGDVLEAVRALLKDAPQED